MRNQWILLTLTALALLAGCNTVQGIGKDIEKGGAAIQRATH
ncbi:MAG: entericidin A/B family lipoprotein [Sterolibacterium sp.]|nr:entericidin A/B family lipoprotein [Sterolibacterium sp.]